LREKIKIPIGLYQSIQCPKIRHSVDFYYQLKSINSTGFIHKNALLEQTKWIGLSEASIYRKISALIDLEWIKKVGNGYRLCSYDRLFAKLKLRYKHWDQGKLDENMRATDLSAFHEVRRNLIKQGKAASQTVLKDRVYQRNYRNRRGATKREFLDSLASTHTAYMVERSLENIELIRNAEDGEKPSKICNPNITLSNRGLQRLLGIRSTSGTHELVKRLEAAGFLLVGRNKRVRVGDKIEYHEFLIKFGFEKYDFIQGYAFRKLPNKLDVSPEFLDLRRFNTKNEEVYDYAYGII
jgi:hypothetical protein